MIDLTFACATPKAFSDALVSLGLAKIDATSKTGITGLLPGVEIVQVPNPVVVTPAVLNGDGSVKTPAVMDARFVYLVRIAHEAYADQVKNAQVTDTTDFDKAAIVKTIQAQGSAQKVGSADSTKISTADGDVSLLKASDAGAFGAWQ